MRASRCVNLTGPQALSQLGMEGVDVNACIGALCVHLAIYRVVAFLGLHFCWTGQPFEERLARFLR